jgi:dihydrofolate reductase
MISMIVAMTDNNLIGKDGDQPVYISADLKRFKELTTGHTVIMGRKTFQAILHRLGKPLPNRTNVVLSRTMPAGEGYTVARSLEEALAQTEPGEEVFIIGGGTVYQDALDRTDRIYLTRVDANIAGDVYFPAINDTSWKTTSQEDFEASGDNPYNYHYMVLERNRG